MSVLFGFSQMIEGMELEYDKVLLALHPLGISVSAALYNPDDWIKRDDPFRLASSYCMDILGLSPQSLSDSPPWNVTSPI
jgi:hypothetical protein